MAGGFRTFTYCYSSNYCGSLCWSLDFINVRLKTSPKLGHSALEHNHRCYKKEKREDYSPGPLP